MMVYNATRHAQDQHGDSWAKLGVTFTSLDPGLCGIKPQAPISWIDAEAEAAVERAVRSGAEAVLVAGIASVVILIALRAWFIGMRVVTPVTRGSTIVGLRDITESIGNIVYKKEFCDAGTNKT
jgi:hypothetical protein